MFILLASGQRLCFSHILLVALIFVLSGSMNTFLDGRPMLWDQSTSCSAPTPNVHPISRTPDLVFSFFFILQLFCSATLGIASQLLLTRGALHSCAQRLCLPALRLGRTAGTNNCLSCLQGFLLNYLPLCLYNYLMSPVPVRWAHWQSWTISILDNACLRWS
jgi:hypothetical protein